MGGKGKLNNRRGMRSSAAGRVQRITKTSLDGIPTMDEMARVIAGLKNVKAPGGGGGGIPAEV